MNHHKRVSTTAACAAAVLAFVTTAHAETPAAKPQGEAVKVQRPEKLVGVNVGDTVELTFTEALAIKVDAAPKQ